MTRLKPARRLRRSLRITTTLSVQVAVTKYTSNRVLVLGAVATPGEVTFEGTPRCLKHSRAAAS